MEELQIPKPIWLHSLQTCRSTNDWAIAQRKILRHGDVVFTENQTQGRGQHGRVWHSAPGILTVSFVLNQVPIGRLTNLSLAAGLAVIYAIADLIPSLKDDLKLKWTNDLMLGGKKLAGILCEAKIQAEMANVVVGIGLNWQTELDKVILPNATSLHEWLTLPIPNKLEMIGRIRHYLLETAGLLSFSSTDKFLLLLAEIRKRDFLLGRNITVALGDEKYDGKASGICDRGYLSLKLDDGEMRSFSSGHIIW